MENKTGHEKIINEQKKDRLIKIYKKYNTFEWIVVALIIATPFLIYRGWFRLTKPK